MAEGFFRSKKGFTVVQNEITKDTNISLKAKGLYLVIQAYISMPDNGKWQAEYELLDEPDLGPHTLYHKSDGEISSDNLTRAEKKRQAEAVDDKEENDRYPLFGTNANEEHRYPPFGSNGKGSNANGNNAFGSNANGGNNNKNYNIKPDIKTNIINPNQYQDEDVMQEEYPMEFIEHHYDMDEEFVTSYQERQIETVKDVLYDTLNTKKSIIRVMGEDKPASVVKSRLLKLNRLDIDYAIEQYKKQVTKVRNHKAYMLTVLYLAKAQGELDVSNRVMYDFYGAGREEDDAGGDGGGQE